MKKYTVYCLLTIIQSTLFLKASQEATSTSTDRAEVPVLRPVYGGHGCPGCPKNPSVEPLYTNIPQDVLERAQDQLLAMLVKEESAQPAANA